MSLSAIHCIFRLGVSVFILAGMTACDDAPETPAQKSSEIEKELRKLQKELDKRLSRTAPKSAPFTVRSLEMRVNEQTVTLSTAETDRIIALGTALCDSIEKAREVGKDKLVSALSDMGHTAASIKITNGQDGSNYKEQIHFDWQGKNQISSCRKGNF